MSQYKAGDKAIVLPTSAFYYPSIFSIVHVSETYNDLVLADGKYYDLWELQPLPIPHSDPYWALDSE